MKVRSGCLFLLCAAILLLGRLSVSAADPVEKKAVSSSSTSTDSLAVTGQVYQIFQAKCLDCHGAQLAKPKGKFGYVLDLKRIASNRDYVILGKPEKSEIYKLVEDDEMPGDDANVPPLTLKEKDTVKQWIVMGAPSELPANIDAHSVAAASSENQKDPEPFWKHLFRWIGRFHPVSTHFPVALMFVAVFAEALAWWTKRESWNQTVRFLVIIAALGGVGAVLLGWINAYFSSYNKAVGALLWWHRWIGTGGGIWALICGGLVLIGDPTEGSVGRKRLRGALFAGAVLIGIAGFLGSALIYGLDHYSWK